MPKKTSKTEEIKTAPKVFDVAKPGETPEPATSRPVIVGHSSMIKRDPMFAEEKRKETNASEEKLTSKKEMKLAPPTIQEEAEDQNPEPKSEEATIPPPEESEKENQKPLVPEETKEPEPDNTEEETEESQEDKKKDKEEAAVARNKEVQEIIDSGEFVLPIHQDVTKSRFGLWLLLIILLIAVGFVLSIDAELLDIGVDLPFDFIKSKE